MKARIPGAQNGGNMMKKIQEMQEDMERRQAQVEESEYSSSAGGGAVEVTVAGTHEVKRIKISPEVVDPDDVEMLEDLVCAAVNEAIKKASDAMDQAMEQAKAGLGALGGGLGGLF
ncbi:MAG: YbaB/EbfC family nucleoid-associated protein [Clostridia bacterium]|nr:YbaB/EbfC family nucleoid-associated protein [Clostridia bacterium]